MDTQPKSATTQECPMSSLLFNAALEHQYDQKKRKIKELVKKHKN